jgi:hypothetical protein
MKKKKSKSPNIIFQWKKCKEIFENFKKNSNSVPIEGTDRMAYITYMDYFATGEGTSVEIQFCWANTSEEAIEIHLNKFEYKVESERNYFRPGIIVYDYRDPKVLELFNRIFVNGEHHFELMHNAAFDLKLKLHWNLG